MTASEDAPDVTTQGKGVSSEPQGKGASSEPDGKGVSSTRRDDGGDFRILHK